LARCLARCPSAPLWRYKNACRRRFLAARREVREAAPLRHACGALLKRGRRESTMKQLVLLILVALVAVTLAVLSAAPSLAAPPPCQAGDPGCKTQDDPTKNNEKFTVTQRGNIGAPGTQETCTGANNGQTKQVC
jgi:hypothetical protein